MRPLKRTFVLLAVVLLFSTCLYAKKIEGYYKKSPGSSKISVTLLIPFPLLGSHPDYERLQNGIRYSDDRSKKNWLLPSEAFEVSFVYKGVTVLIRSVYNTLSNKQMFLHLIVDGNVKLYHYYESNYSAGMYNPTTGMTSGGGKRTVMRLVLQRDDELFRVRRLFFKKDLTEFFADCPTLLDRLHSVSVSDLPALVMAYNKNCE